MSLSATLKAVTETIRAIDAASSDAPGESHEAVVMLNRGGMSLTGETAIRYGDAAAALCKTNS